MTGGASGPASGDGSPPDRVPPDTVPPDADPPDTDPSGADSPDVDGLDFREIDWEAYEGGSSVPRRHLAFCGIVAAAVVAWALDAAAGIDRGARFETGVGPASVAPAPGHVDWLFALTLLVVGWAVVVPLVRNPRTAARYWRGFRRNRAAVAGAGFLIVVLAAGVVGPLLLGRPSIDLSNTYRPPVFMGGTWAHPLGTTRSGEDLLRVVVAGMRVSMQVGLIGTAVVVVVATTVGTVAATAGGLVDEALMRFVDVVLTFPTFFLVLLVVYLYGGDLFTMTLILGGTTWAATSRVVRSEALQRVEEGYVTAAEAAGASRAWIVWRHVVPNVSNTVVTAATLVVPSLILYEAALAFLGFGDPDVWSWGRVIAEGRSDLQNAPWIATIPGAFLFATVLAFNFLGDALRDALDPRHEVDRR